MGPGSDFRHLAVDSSRVQDKGIFHAASPCVVGEPVQSHLQGSRLLR